MAKTVWSCRDCTDRYPGCHDKCEIYAKARAEYEEEKERIKRAKIERDNMLGYYLCKSKIAKKWGEK